MELVGCLGLVFVHQWIDIWRQPTAGHLKSGYSYRFPDRGSGWVALLL